MSNEAEPGDPGLPVVPYAAPVCEPDPVTGRCATCADEALEGRVLRVGEDALADVELDGAVRTVAVELLDDVRPGDVVLVHAGVAIGTAGAKRPEAR